MFYQSCAYLALGAQLYAAFIPRDYQLEAFVPSQRLALVRRFGVHKPALFLHPLGVDAQWKYYAICKHQLGGKSFAAGKLLFSHNFS